MYFSSLDVKKLFAFLIINGIFIGVLGTILVVATLQFRFNNKNIGIIEYKFQDTLEFVDKDTDETVKKLDNVEFRVLDKNRYMYLVKTPDLPSPEVLIMNEFPPNTYLRFYQTSAGE